MEPEGRSHLGDHPSLHGGSTASFPRRIATTKAEEVARSLEPQALDLYAGDYEFSDMGGLTLNVTRAENKLVAAGPGQATQEMLPLSKGCCLVFGSDGRMECKNGSSAKRQANWN